MAYLPFREILNYLTTNPGQWFGESHLAQLYPAARAEVPAVLRALVEGGQVRMKVDENRRPLYRLSGPRAEHAETEAGDAVPGVH